VNLSVSGVSIFGICILYCFLDLSLDDGYLSREREKNLDKDILFELYIKPNENKNRNKIIKSATIK